MRALSSSICCMALACIAGAQDSSKSADGGAWTLATRAEKLIGEKKLDEALVTLWEAERLIPKISGDMARDMVRKSVEALLKTVDPLVGRRRQACVDVAGDLAKLAQKYVRKKWYRSAKVVLEIGADYSADVVAKRLAYVEKRLGASAKKPAPAPAETKDSSEPKDYFEDFRAEHYTSDNWRADGREFVSPRIVGKTEFVIAGNVHHKDQRIRWQVQVDGKSEASGALVFGAIADDDYYLAEIGNFAESNDGRATLFYWDGAKVHRLAEEHFKTTLETRGAWRQGELHVRGRQLMLHVDGKKVVAAIAPRDTHGAVGLFVNGRSKNPEPVRFRRLWIDALPAEDSTAPQDADPSAEARTRLIDALSHAEAKIDAGQAEDAAIALRALRTELAVGGETTSASLHETLRALLTKADPVLAERRRTGTSIAERFGELASGYAAADRGRAALLMLDEARRFDRKVAAEQESALSAKLANVLAAVRGLGAEPDQPSDDRALREEFEGGKRLWSAATWRFENAELVAPAPQDSGTALIGKTANTKYGTVRVQVRGTGKNERALVFSHRSRHDFWVASFLPRKKGQLILAHYFGGKWTDRIVRDVKFSSEALASWVTIEVAFDDKTIRARFGQAEPFEIKTPSGFRPAKFGLWLAPGDGNGASFRNFAFEPAK